MKDSLSSKGFRISIFILILFIGSTIILGRPIYNILYVQFIFYSDLNNDLINLIVFIIAVFIDLLIDLFIVSAVIALAGELDLIPKKVAKTPFNILKYFGSFTYAISIHQILAYRERKRAERKRIVEKKKEIIEMIEEVVNEKKR